MSQTQNIRLAVIDNDSAASSRAVEADPQVDALEREAEAFVIRMLALRQPMAQDLRHIVSSLKITGDLERIGDYAANVEAARRGTTSWDTTATVDAPPMEKVHTPDMPGIAISLTTAS